MSASATRSWTDCLENRCPNALSATAYAARIEDLGPGDLVKVDCAACHHVALLPPGALLRVGLLPAAKVLDLQGALPVPRVRKEGASGGFGEVGAQEDIGHALLGSERKAAYHVSPIGRCGETLYSAPSRRLAGLVSFGIGVCGTSRRPTQRASPWAATCAAVAPVLTS